MVLRTRLIFLVYAVVCYGLCFYTPPFQVPDEHAHFFRAYQLSEGKMGGTVQGSAAGDDLPTSLEWIKLYMQGRIPFNVDEGFNHTRMIWGLKKRLQPEIRQFTEFSNTVIYSPVAYIPQAAAIWMGRAAGVRPLELMYLGRLVTVTVCLFLLWCCFKILPPAFHYGFIALIAAPMFVFQMASLSADAVINTLSFLLFAAIAKVAFFDESDSRRPILFLIGLLCVTLALTKPVYLLFSFALLAIPSSRFLSRRHQAVYIMGTVSVAFLGVLAWAVYTKDLVVPVRPWVATDPAQQLLYILRHPIAFSQDVLTNYVRHWRRYAGECVGRLGWLDAPVPWSAVRFYIAGFLLFSLSEYQPNVRVDWRRKLLFSGIMMAVLAGTTVLVYAAWFEPGAPMLGRVLQGRYLMPLGPLAVFVLYDLIPFRRFGIKMESLWLRCVVLVFVTLMLAITLHTLSCRYYRVTGRQGVLVRPRK